MWSRRGAIIGAAASILLHGAVAVWLHSVPRSPAPDHVPSPDWVEMTVELSNPPEPVPRDPSRTPGNGANGGTPQKPRLLTPSSAGKTPPKVVAKAATDVPVAAHPAPGSRTPPLPSADALSSLLSSSNNPERGRTLRPGDPSISKAARDAETVDRVGSRVQGWAEDTLAQARAQKGLAHPYLANLRETFKEQLGVPNGPTPRDLGVGSAVKEMARNYRTAVQAFGRNGTPDLPPPGHAPTQSEVLAELYRDDPNGALPLRMLVAAEELAHALRGSRPLLSLTLELRQDRRGAILGAAVTESSGNPHFDAFVLAVGRTAPQALPEPPADAFRSDVLRSIWQVEGWLRNSRNGPQAMKMVPGFMGASPELLMREINSGNARFDFRARLLKAY